MTNRDALDSELAGLPINEASIVKAFALNSVDATGEFSIASEEAVDRSLISVLYAVMLSPDISEGGYSVKYPREWFEKRIAFLSAKWKINNPLAPTVKAVNVW